MRGRSVEYSLALDRPIDMMPPIWPCALRLIQTKKPMMIAPYKRNGSSEASQLLVVLEKLRLFLTLACSLTAMLSGRGWGPDTEYLVPFLSV